MARNRMLLVLDVDYDPDHDGPEDEVENTIVKVVENNSGVYIVDSWITYEITDKGRGVHL